MKHPTCHIADHLLLSSTLAFIGGIVFASRVAPLGSSLTVLGAILLFLLAGLIILQLSNRPRLLLSLLPVFCVGLGFLHTQLHLQVPGDEQHIYNRITGQSDLILIGTMTAMEKFDGRTSQVSISAEKLQYKDKHILEPVKGTVLLSLPGNWPQDYLPGDRLAIRTELKRPASYRTPGGFDYTRYLARADIWVTGFIRSPQLLHKVDSPSSLLHRLRYLPERTRAKLGQHIDGAVDGRYSGVYRAILIGDRSRIDDLTLESFKGSGTMHILAISGLHMAVIGSLMYAVFYYLLSRSEKILLRFTAKKWAAFLSLPLLVGYGFLAGMNTPVVRAVVMSGIIIIAICTDRKKSPAPLLAFAALVILTLDPLQIFNASFQLSFAAVGAILVLLPGLQKFLTGNSASSKETSVGKKLMNWLITAMLLSLAATLVTAPISVHTFNRFSIIGPLANLVIEPLICLWSLPAGFLAIPFIAVVPEISTLFLEAGSLGLKVALHAASFFSSFPFATLWLPPPPILLLLCYYLSLAVLAMWGLRTKKRTMTSCFAMILCIIFLIKITGAGWFSEQSDGFQVSFLDVGQGSAALVELSSGQRILIDGGGSPYSAKNVGERVIAPFLWNKGIVRLDAVAITHPDADHYNGLGFILKNFSPTVLWVRDRDGHDDQFRHLIRLAENAHIPIIIPEDQQRIGEAEENLTCIANTRKKRHCSRGVQHRNTANSGLVLKACYRDFCVLFPGDIEKEDEKLLVEEGYDLNADILLAPHHGSSTSSSNLFLTQVSPECMIVSAGRSPTGNFPHRQVREECRRQQITLLSTARQGTLELSTTREGYQLFGYTRAADNPLYPLQPILLRTTGKSARWLPGSVSPIAAQQLNEKQ